MHKDYSNKLRVMFLLLSVILIVTSIFIAVICLFPNNKEDLEIIYIESKEISTENIETTCQKETTYIIEEEILVWISKTGKRYHTIPDCSNMKNPLQITIDEAEIREYTPCKRCH